MALSFQDQEYLRRELAAMQRVMTREALVDLISTTPRQRRMMESYEAGRAALAYRDAMLALLRAQETAP
jgi:hypothetical protein